MIIENLFWLPFILIFFIFYLVWILKTEKSFFKLIEDHWFFKRANLNKLATILYLIGFLGLILSLIDIRGKEEVIDAKNSNQKTVILIDMSSSMLAEDIRPNRFKKAILLARHFIKNAVGHEISIIVFSDAQKQIVPFTTDVDLLNARLLGLEKMNLNQGGTALSLAIAEGSQYLIGEGGEIAGNILLLTDSEENESPLDIKVNDNISVGLIAIGTSKGAPIPLRDHNGSLLGNKKYNGETVITKIDEKYLESLKNKISNYRYWIATSYSLPTSEVLSFFNSEHEIKIRKGKHRVRPVLTQYLLIPSLFIFMLSFLFKINKIFLSSIFIFLFLQYPVSLFGSEKEAPKKNEKIQKLELSLKNGEATLKDKLSLAQEYYKNKFLDESKKLYEETLEGEEIKDYFDEKLNYAATLFESGELERGLKLSEKLLRYAKKENLKTKERLVKENLLKALESDSQEKKNDKDKKKDQDKKESKDEKNKDNKDNQSQDEQKNEEKKGQDKDKQSDEMKNEQNKKNKEGQENKDKNNQKKEDQGEDQKGENKDNRDNKEEKQDGQNERDNKDKKLPSLLNQLINDDNALQKKLIDAETKKKKDQAKKDW